MATRYEWAAALRSGEYEQAQEWLLDGDAYCCLGVRLRLDGHTKQELHDRQSPPEVSPDYTFVGTADAVLAWLNDSADYTFDQIADVLTSPTAAERALDLYMSDRYVGNPEEAETRLSVADFKAKYFTGQLALF